MNKEVEVEGLIRSADGGDDDARRQLMSKLYAELRGVARRQLLGASADRTLNTTALVHEAFLRLARLEQVEFSSRARFLAYSARVMRNVLIDEARQKSADKHGGHLFRVEWSDESSEDAMSPEQLLALDQALSELDDVNPKLARVIELRVFGGLSAEECAEAMEISLRSVHRYARTARAILAPVLRPAPGDAG